MSVTVASPASLEPWSASQRKAASRIFAQALFSALRKAPSEKAIQNPWNVTREVQSNEIKTLENPQCVPVSSETDESDYSDEESSCYSDSYYDESSFCEVCCNFFRWH